MLAAPLVQHDLPREVVADLSHHTRHSYASTLREVVIGHPIMPDLRVLDTPTRLLYGDSDDIANVDRVRVLAAQHRAIAVDVVSGDHQMAIRNAATVARTLHRMLFVRARLTRYGGAITAVEKRPTLFQGSHLRAARSRRPTAGATRRFPVMSLPPASVDS